MPDSDLLLTLDRGNSTLDCRLWSRESAVTERVCLRPEEGALADRLDAFVAGRGLLAVCGVTVVAGGLDEVIAPLEKRGQRLLRAGIELACPLQLAYPDPSELGADRWVGAFAAHRRAGNAIAVDCGTAVTVNAVDGDGCFLGGSIGAGLGTVAAALAARAPALPAFDFAAPRVVPAVTTLDAVRAGVGQAFVAGVQALVARCARAFPAAVTPRVGLTGGDAERVFRCLPADLVEELGWEHWPELIHDGLTELWKAVHDVRS